MNTAWLNSVLARLILLCMLLSLVSCTSEKRELKEQADSSRSSDTSALRYASDTKVAQDSLPRYRLDSLAEAFERMFDVPRDELVHTLGDPTRIDVDTIVNPYYGDLDSMFAYHFGSTVLQFYSATHVGRFFLKGVGTEDFRRFSAYGVFDGMTADSLVRLYGPFSTSFSNDSDKTVSLTYEMGEVKSSYLTFTFRSNALIRIYYQAGED